MEITEKICGACLQLKPIKFFHKNVALKTGYDKRCKICKVQGRKCQTKSNTKKIVQRKNALGLYKPTKEDYEMMYRLLKYIGYNPKNAHQEFTNKWGLPEKNRNNKDRNLFTAEDFDL